MAPSDSNARALLECEKEVASSAEITDTIDDIIDSLRVSNEFNSSDIFQAVRNLRTTEIGFIDDGSDTALALYDALENVLDNKRRRKRRNITNFKNRRANRWSSFKRIF